MITNIIILVILLFLSAFFSATEVAFISLTNAKVSAMIKKDYPKSKLIKKLKDNPRRLLITILIGNNIVNIASASLATIVASEFFDSAVLGVTTGVMTILVLIFGEIVPKSYASNHNKKFAIFSAPIIKILQWLLLPFIIILEWVTVVFAGKQREEKVSEEELKAMAHAGVKQGTIEYDEKVMIERLFALNDLMARDIMTNKSKIVSIPERLSVEEAADLIADTNHTRFPVVHKNLDHIIGFVHSRDVLIALQHNKEKAKIENIIHPILRVDKKKRLDHLLKEFQRENIHMAVVEDNKGNTLGVITLEDVLEELVGEITDEHDEK